VVSGLEGFAHDDRRGANRLLNEPTAVRDVGNQLQHLVARIVRAVNESAWCVCMYVCVYLCVCVCVCECVCACVNVCVSMLQHLVARIV